MDELARTNQKRWSALVEADVPFSRPFLDLDDEKARQELDPYGVMGNVQGKKVLCLAGGGGQQSAAFAILGACVTVLDLTAGQLAQDRAAAAHYGTQVLTEQGDMRDLSRFASASFDLVYQPYSINFVPAPLPVLSEVARVLSPGGLYRLDFANPFVLGADEHDWTPRGYAISHIYQDSEVEFGDPNWEVWDSAGNLRRMPGPREFRHTLSTMLNGLIARGFTLLGVWEEDSGFADAEPGSWDHFKAVAPPYLKVWARLDR